MTTPLRQGVESVCRGEREADRVQVPCRRQPRWGWGGGGRTAQSWGRGKRERQARAGWALKLGPSGHFCVSPPAPVPPAPALAPAQDPFSGRAQPCLRGRSASEKHLPCCSLRFPLVLPPRQQRAIRVQKWGLVCAHCTPLGRDTSFHTRGCLKLGLGVLTVPFFFFFKKITLIFDNGQMELLAPTVLGL